MSSGMSSGPTPWWQTTPQMGEAETNMSNSAPNGYKYDPVQMQYVRTPVSLGQDAGASINGLTSTLNGFGMIGQGASTGGYSSGSPSQVSGPSASSFGSAGASPYTPPATITGAQYGNTPAQIAAIKGPDNTAANAAAYASAKDQVGQSSRGALTGLAGAMAGRGIVGSGVEGRGQVGIVNQGQEQMGEVSRGLAENQANQAEQNALASYQGDVTQRGQDIGNLNAQEGFGVTQRGQDIGAETAANSNLTAQRGQDMSLAGLEYNGGVTQRGQDIQSNEFGATNSLQQQQLALQRQTAALQALQGYGSLAKSLY